jgi:hypothetical protein
MSQILHRGGPEWTKRRQMLVFDTQDRYFGVSGTGGMVACLPATESGRIGKLTEQQQRTWDTYRDDTRYFAEVVELEEKTYTPTVVKCNCGTHVDIWADADECPTCHQVYNLFGQELAPPSQWERDDYEATYGPQNYDDPFYWEEMHY